MRGHVACMVSAALGLAMVSGRGLAQEKPVLATREVREAIWPGTRAALSTGSKVKIVTLANPKKKQNCLLAALDAETIECSKHGGKTMSYRRTEVMAILEPGTSSHLGFFFGGILATSGAAFWGAVVLAAACPGCAVGLSVVGTLLILGSGACAFADSGDKPERLIYLRPGETLQVKLR